VQWDAFARADAHRGCRLSSIEDPMSVLTEEEIFAAAVQKPPTERASFLDRACGGEAVLRSQVESLLRAHDGPDSLLDAPGHCATIAAVPSIKEPPGTLIGPYKLLEQIGEGGMGLVYMAEQQQPVRRLVALKIIKPGFDSKQTIARFEAERQALAMMDHPNIAKVHDAGTTETGRPYFVMELVRGIPLNEFCDQKRLVVRERLQLFVQVCQAVQHAHQKGIIHRDLKPTNVLVAMADTVAFPKLLDFGIAKALGQSLTDNTLHTGYSQLVGTPLYMSPEQAEMNVFGVDTRSDVYSLGVLLYELLTGTTPFDKEQLTKASFDEMRRMIREDDPLRPSARMSTLKAQALSTISQQRNIDPRRISATLRGELDWIVMKSLEKDRSRRYESASALATDIQRYLSDEPVLACPPTTMYRFQKFARKHKPALFTAAAIALCLLLGTTVSAWQAVRATAAEGQAAANEQKAVANAAAAQEKEQEAIKQRDEVKALNDKLAAKERQLQKTLYAAHINLAQNAWNSGGLRRVNELLEQHHVKPGETDLRGFEWHYLYRLCHPELLTLKANVGDWPGDRGVAFSPDGKRLAFARGTWNEATKAYVADELKVCDAQTGQELLSCKGHTKRIMSVAFSPDGKRLASAGGDLKIWDAETGKELHDLKGHTGGVMTAAFSPDGKLLASASSAWQLQQGKWEKVASEVKIWDALKGQELFTSKGHLGDIHCVAFSPDGQRLASGDAANGTVKVWDVPTGQDVLTFVAQATGHVASLAFSPDGKRLVSGGYPGAKVWDAQTGKELFAFKELTGQVNSVALSRDGKRLASTRGSEVRVWDAQTGEEIQNFKGHTGAVASAVFNPEGTRLATASNDGTVRVWDASTNHEAPAFSGARGRIRSVGFGSDGKLVAGISWDQTTRETTARVWDSQTGKERTAFKEQPGEKFHRVSLSPDGKRIAAGIGIRRDSSSNTLSTGRVKVWDTETGREVATFKGHSAPVVDVVFSPDSARVISCSGHPNGIGSSDNGEPGEVKVWTAETGDELLTLVGHKRFVNSVAYSPNGKRLGTLSRDGTLKVWDAETGRELLTIPVQISDRGNLAFSPDGKRIAASNRTPNTARPAQVIEITMWDSETGVELMALQGHNTWVTGVVFSPDGKRLASGTGGGIGGGEGNEVKLWDAQTGEELVTFEKIGGGGVAFSPDGNRFVSAGSDGLKIYNATPLPEKP